MSVSCQHVSAEGHITILETVIDIKWGHLGGRRQFEDTMQDLTHIYSSLPPSLALGTAYFVQAWWYRNLFSAWESLFFSSLVVKTLVAPAGRCSVVFRIISGPDFSDIKCLRNPSQCGRGLSLPCGFCMAGCVPNHSPSKQTVVFLITYLRDTTRKAAQAPASPRTSEPGPFSTMSVPLPETSLLLHPSTVIFG